MMEANARNKLIFISDAAKVVEDINSKSEPKGWYTSEDIYNIHACLFKNNWNITWNRRSANRLADCPAKLSLSSCNPFFFTTFNLECLPETFCNIYISKIVGGLSSL